LKEMEHHGTLVVYGEQKKGAPEGHH